MTLSPRAAALLVILGVSVLVAGVALLSVPAGMIVAGTTLAGLGIVIDDGKDAE
jgi:hypothetical protein